MQSDPSTILRAIAFGSGVVRPEALVGIGDAEARAWLKSSPEDALKLLGEPTAGVRLRKYGISVEKLNDELRASIDACVSRARREQGADEFACCVCQLILGARLTVASQDLSWLVPGRSAAQLVAAARDLSVGRLEPVNEVKPASLARLLLSPRVLAIGDPWTKNVVARAIRSSLIQLSPSRALTVTAQVRVVAAMALTACSEDEFELEAILEAAGIPEGLWHRIRDEVQSESGVASIFAGTGGEPDFERLQAHEGFARAANWLGFRFDPAHMRVRVLAEREMPQAKDPWVRLACARAMAGDVAMTDLLAELGVARASRARVLAGLVDTRTLGEPDAITVLDEEFRVHGGDGLASRAFRALFQSIHVQRSLEPKAVPAKLDVWLAGASEGFAADPRSMRELKSDSHFLACLVAGLHSGIECLKPFRREAKEELSRRRREKLKSSGRLWLVELVDHCRSRSTTPEHWDGGREALTPEDCAFVGRLIAMSATEGEESKDWYCEQRLPLEASLEFRLREAAYAGGFHSREDFVADVEAQRRRVEAAAIDLGLPGDRIDRLRTMITRAAQALVEGPDRSAEDSRVLAAFRNADAGALRGQIERARVRLPYRSVPYSLIGPLSAAAIFVCVGCALWMVIDIAAATGPALPRPTPPGTATFIEPTTVDLPQYGLGVAPPVTRSSVVVATFLPEIKGGQVAIDGLTDLEARTLRDRVQKFLDGLPNGSQLVGGARTLTTPITVVVKRNGVGTPFKQGATVRQWGSPDFKRWSFELTIEPRAGTPTGAGVP
jgi:hypothetical protein